MIVLTAAHHVVRYCAADGLDLSTPLVGIETVIGSGERFPIVIPIPASQARAALLDLLEAGAIRLAEADAPSRDDWVDLATARAIVADTATWDLSANVPGAYRYEMYLTSSGESLLTEAHRRFGHAIDRAWGSVEEAAEAFRQRHPDHVEQNAKYLRAMDRWVITGRGPQPQPPQFD